MLKRMSMLIVVACLVLALTVLSADGALAASNVQYRIDVDIANQIVTVYRLSDSAIVRQMICSTGKNNRTPRGTFKLYTRKSTDRKEWYHISSQWYVKYATRITGHFLFHSVPFTKPNMNSVVTSQFKLLGQPASAGCVRLHWDDAKWISDNCLDGTKVHIFTGAAKNRPLKAALMISRYSAESGLSYEDYLASSYVSQEPEVLGRGANSEQVLTLQNRLSGLGFLVGDVTGEYDNATIAAIIMYQRSVGLEPTGLTNPALYDRILSDDSHVGTVSTLAVGANGPLVYDLQALLQSLGLYEGDVDGHYTEDLAEAVNIFSIYNGTGGTRKATPELRSAAAELLQQLNTRYGEGNFSTVLNSETVRTVKTKASAVLYKSALTSSKKLKTIAKGKKVTLISEGAKWSRVTYGGKTGYMKNSALKSTYTTRFTLYWGIDVDALGARALDEDCIGGAVKALQQRLNALGFFTGECDGKYDSGTADAVKAYQREAGLTETGVADVALQAAIQAEDACTGTAIEQKDGMEGPIVRALQKTLRALQYYDGDCGGKYDEATGQAVRLFTKSNGFTETDVASPEIQQAIRDQYRDCESRYGSGHYQLSIEEVSTQMAKLRQAENLYKAASTGSKKLKAVAKGKRVIVISKGRKWTEVIYGTLKGYMRNSKLKFYTQIDYVAQFTSLADNAELEAMTGAEVDAEAPEAAMEGADEAASTEDETDSLTRAELSEYDEDSGLSIETEAVPEDQTIAIYEVEDEAELTEGESDLFWQDALEVSVEPVERDSFEVNAAA